MLNRLVYISCMVNTNVFDDVEHLVGDRENNLTEDRWFDGEEIKKKYETKLRKLQSLRSKCTIRKRIWKRRSNKIYNRIENLVDDIHYGIINELVENYDKIYMLKDALERWTYRVAYVNIQGYITDSLSSSL